MKKNSVKILFASRAKESAPREGGFVVLTDIARKLSNSKTGFSPFMFSTNHKTSDNIGTECIYSDIGWNRKLRLEFFLGLYRKAHFYDIVHTAHIPTKLNTHLIKFAIKKARKSGTLFVQTITGLPATNINQEELKKLIWGDHIVCQSEGTYKKVRKLISSSQSCSLITPWRPDDIIQFDKGRRIETRKKLFAGYKHIVIFPGEFDRLGVDVKFRECIKSFFENSKDSLVVFACRFDKKGTGQIIASEFPHQVKSLGSTDNIIPLLEGSDLVIYPVRTMDHKFQPPLVILEALQLKSKVLISDAIEIKQDLSSLIEYEKVDDWAVYGKTMAKILASKKNTTLHVNHYSFNNMYEQYFEIYNSLIK